MSAQLTRIGEVLAACDDTDTVALRDWVHAFLMRPHPDLGRTGHVCPFTAMAMRLSLLRIAVSPLTSGQDDAIFGTMKAAMRAFEALPAARATRKFRTVMVGFPQCAGADGVATLRRVQNALRHHSVVRGKMIGLFEPSSEAEGLLNPAFRPLRAPIPTLAIRMLVEQDAAFVMRNPLLAPIYLAKFPIAGSRRLLGLLAPLDRLTRWRGAPRAQDNPS